MECRETGTHHTVRLAHVPLDLAEDLNEVIGGVKNSGNGNGQVTLALVNGVVTYIDYSARRHRHIPKRIVLKNVS